MEQRQKASSVKDIEKYGKGSIGNIKKGGKMSEKKQPKKDFNQYETLMKHKFDIEDRMVKIANEKWKLNNENMKCGRQLRLVEDQVRNMFNRFRVKLKEEESS